MTNGTLTNKFTTCLSSEEINWLDNAQWELRMSRSEIMRESLNRFRQELEAHKQEAPK
jgi:hypothetical protein